MSNQLHWQDIERSFEGWLSLTIPQRKAITARALVATDKDAAELVGVHPATLGRWRRESAIYARLEAAALLAPMALMLALADELAVKSIWTLLDTMAGQDKRARVEAAKAGWRIQQELREQTKPVQEYRFIWPVDVVEAEVVGTRDRHSTEICPALETGSSPRIEEEDTSPEMV